MDILYYLLIIGTAGIGSEVVWQGKGNYQPIVFSHIKNEGVGVQCSTASLKETTQ